VPAELRGVQAQGLVECAALVVVQVHGHVHGQAEEARPQLGDGALQQPGLGLEQRSEEVTVPAAAAAGARGLVAVQNSATARLDL
jgi:hypothetical protein